MSTAVVGRRDDFLAFRLALAASFALSPIVWGHYYVLLAVALALRWPRLSPVWLAAIWIKDDTLVLPQPQIWIGLALLVLAIQLDLLTPLRREWSRPTSRWARYAIGVAVVVSVLIASKASTEEGPTRTAPLYSTSARSNASGAAFVRVDHSHRDLCWRVWTQALPPGLATIAFRRLDPATAWLTAKTDLHRDGQAISCTSLTPRQVSLARDLATNPRRYAVDFSVAGAGSIMGAFKTPPRGFKLPW
jgi:hypothetical protein